MSEGPFRLPAGGHIDRAARIEFRFDGHDYSGHGGDTLASALLANGVRLVGRSFKYHRPRGVMCAGVEEPNALVTLGSGARREPNIPATMVELAPGLEAASQNRWPSLRFDVMAVNQLFAPLLSAGFYYKTFKGPTRRSWLLYEHVIRRAAGLGKASTEPDPDRYDTEYAFADVAVIGAGPAGLAAAVAAQRAGARVMLIEQDFAPGGGLLAEPAGSEAAQWIDTMQRELGTVLRLRTTAFGLYDGNMLGLVERRNGETARQRLVLLRANSIVFATGAMERPLLFANNDRPGVMLASAVRNYLNRFAVACGRRAVIATEDDSAYATARALAAAGVDVTLLDARPAGIKAEFPVLPQARLLGVKGGSAVHAAIVEVQGRRMVIPCDLVATCGGWTPTIHLTSHLGVKPIYREDIDAFVPGRLGPGQFVAGAVTGAFTTSEAIRAGEAAGREAAGVAGRKASAESIPALSLADKTGPASSQELFVPNGKVFIDFQNDVTTADIALAHREGFRSVEHLKRYTTLGMGTDQGKTANVAALKLMAAARGVPVAEAGTTTFRPPFSPVAVGALAGRAVGQHFKPIRRTPLHEWHIARGAEMIEVGLWKRPLNYPQAGEAGEPAYVTEMRLVRSAAGMVDVSTLGKIEVIGPDAVAFLERIYVNAIAKLKPGYSRHVAMLRDDGIVFDDGVLTRLGPDRFFLTTSTARAPDVQSWFEFLAQTAWPDLKVHIVSVTDQWAAIALAGPLSGSILVAAFPALDTSDAALPKMGSVEGRFAGAPLRIHRMSYSGERAYELYVGARQGEALALHLDAAGAPFGLKPYGVDAMGALRIEKGYAAGGEIDGTTTLEDIGLGMVARPGGGFVGDVLRKRPALADPSRRQLVGLECLKPDDRLRSGAILFAEGAPRVGHGIGHITAVTYSPDLDRHIALALLAGGPSMLDRTVISASPVHGEATPARVVSPAFLDPQGTRLDA
jgi:heterotetrameric sarcosine oxidase alpha subunit